MSEIYGVCANCGRQIVLDGLPGEKCYLCRQPARIESPCGVTGGRHNWKKSPLSKYVERGECDCGSIKFFPHDNSTEALKYTEIQNSKHYRPGKVLVKNRPDAEIISGRLVSEVISHEIKKTSSELGINPSTTLGVKEERNMVGQINVKELLPETREKIGLTKEAMKIAEKLGKQVATRPPDVHTEPGRGVKSGAGENHAVTPRADIRLYTREEKAAIAREGQACASKTGRKVLAEFYGITPRMLHGWYMVYIANKEIKKEVTPARLEQLANARAARKDKAAALPGVSDTPSVKPTVFYCPPDCPERALPKCSCPGIGMAAPQKYNPLCPSYKKSAAEPPQPEEKPAKNLRKYFCPPNCSLKDFCKDGSNCPGAMVHDYSYGNCPNFKPPVGEKYICMDDCERPREKCNFIAKRTADPSAGNCPGYIPPRKPAASAHTAVFHIDTRQVEEEIERYKSRLQFLNQLRMLCLPSPRWWWSQKTLRLYISTIERLINK